MSLQGQQMSVPVPTNREVEQVLLGLADGGYVLSTPDGAVAECGAGVVALLGASAERLGGRPVIDVLAAGADPSQRAAFERLLRGERDDAGQVFATATAAGAARSVGLIVVSVPLALGWEFTSLLGELAARDADGWDPEDLRLRHERALAAVEGVVLTGEQPEHGGRLAGILIVVRDAAAPPLTREDVGRRMAEQREAARAAAKEAELLAMGNSAHRVHSGEPGAHGGGLEDLVERAHMLRERVEEAEHEAAEAQARLAVIEAQRDAEREGLHGQLAAIESERERAAATQAEHERVLDELGTAQDERELALELARSEQAEHERAVERLETEHAERVQAVARLAAVQAEHDAEAQRREAAEAHAAAARASEGGRVEQVAAERDEARAAAAAATSDAAAARAAEAEAREQAGAALAAAHQQVEAAATDARERLDAARAEAHAARAEAEAARAGTDDARAQLEAARAESERVRVELQELRASIHAERASSVTADAELQGLRSELEAAQAGADAARAELREAHAQTESLRDELTGFRQEHASLRVELTGVRAGSDTLRSELTSAHADNDTLRSELNGAHADNDTLRNELTSARGDNEARRAELTTAHGEIDALRDELTALQDELDATRASAEDVRAEREQARQRASQLLTQAENARAAVEAIRAEFAFEDISTPPAAATPGADPPSAPRTPWAAPVQPPPAAATPQPSDPADHVPELPPCEPGVGAALIGLDGRFKRLDDAFSTLLGCREDELRGARWPSIIDRENREAHQEIARALVAGEIQSADIETIYMHAGGLLVPVEGSVTVRRDEHGRPTHYVLRADVRRTSDAIL